MGWLDRLDRRTTGIVLGLLAFALYLAAGEPQALRDSHYPFAQAFLAGRLDRVEVARLEGRVGIERT